MLKLKQARAEVTGTPFKKEMVFFESDNWLKDIDVLINVRCPV
jgi:hypothetical protein